MKKNFSKIMCFSLFLGTISIAFIACQKEEVSKPLSYAISTQVGAVTNNSASCIVRLLAESGSEDIYKKVWFLGIIWDTNDYPTLNKNTGFLSNNMQPNGNSGSSSGTLQYTFQMTNLKPNTTYYVESFATIDGYLDGTVQYGPVVTFTTPTAAPNLQLVSLQVNGSLYQNQTGSFTATLKNNGTAAYNSDLWIYLFNSNTGAYQYLGGIIPSIGAGVSKTITFTDTVTLQPDIYDCNVVYDANNDPNNTDYYQFYNALGVKATVN